MDEGFVHLDVKTAYNYHFDSLVRVDQLIQSAKKSGMSAVAVTDETVLHSAIEFYLVAKKNGINPIIGLTVTVFDEQEKTTVPVILLAKNYAGYQNIIRASSLSHLRRKKQKYITLNEFKKLHTDTVVMMDLEKIYFDDNDVLAKNWLQRIQQISNNEDFYLILKNHGVEKQNEINKKIVALASEKKIKIIASNDVHYLNQTEANAREVLCRIQDEKHKNLYETNQKYFKSATEMKSVFHLYPEAVSNTIEVAKKCNLVIPMKGEAGFQNKLPKFPIPKDFTPPKTLKGKFEVLPNFQKPKSAYEVLAISYLCDLAEKGFEKLYGKNAEVEKRLRYELGVVISKGFTNYFLIVQDFVAYSKSKGIIPGPGRGSAAGALVAYCLGITDVDPIEYHLMFERFLNPEREDDPDIDIDFPTLSRFELFSYAQKKYGVASTAKIITFNNFKGKLAIRDVGRVLKVNDKVVNTLAKSINESTKELLQQKELVLSLIKKDKKVTKLIEYASAIEGLPKNRSIHAAGLVLCEGHFSDSMPVMIADDDEMGKPILVTQVHKDLLEIVGFTKIDFLGLRNLDIIEKVKEMVKQNKGIDLTEIPLTDEKTFSLYQTGETLGVFQMDSKQIRQVAMQVKPNKIQDIFPLIALYRPGSMDMIPIYAKNRANNEFVIYDMVEEYDIEKKKMVKKFIPFEKNVQILRPILDETYGVIIYQEQIIKILQTWAGYRLGEADIVRRAISKKKKEVLEENKKIFLERSIQMGRELETSERLYELIVKFANYGFNVPHSASYGILSYETAYLKANFPIEFMSASITSLMDEIDRAAIYIKEAIRMGLIVEKPNINASTAGFDVMEGGLHFGLAVVKNVGVKAATAIVHERKNGLFRSFDDFMKRMEKKEANKKAIESLIKIGAFDSFGNRKELFEAFHSKEKKNPLLLNQFTFDDIPFIGGDNVQSLKKAKDFSRAEKILFEEQLLCMRFTEYPSQVYQSEIEAIVAAKNEGEKGKDKWLVGTYVSKKVTKDRNKNEMAFLTFHDGRQEVSFAIFHQLWDKIKKNLNLYHLYLVKLKERNGRYSIDEIEEFLESKRMILQLDKDFLSKNIKSLAQLIKQYPGTDQLVLAFGKNKKGYGIDLSANFIQELQKLQLSKENITFEQVRYE